MHAALATKTESLSISEWFWRCGTSEKTIALGDSGLSWCRVCMLMKEGGGVTRTKTE